ncbi:MAG: hypothetical protein L0Z62_29205, partial [Gemmataceae bacterium]|nr:hypothetical protein [Gemmataceae bacterium]
VPGRSHAPLARKIADFDEAAGQEEWTVRNATERWLAFGGFLAAGVFGLVAYGEAPFAPMGLTFVVIGVGGLAFVAVSALRALWRGPDPWDGNDGR